MKLLFSLFLTYVACVSFGCSQTPITSEQNKSPTPQVHSGVRIITETQAIELAEKFIVRNGYTELPPDMENLSHESIEWESNMDAMLKKRRDTLEKRAFGVMPDRKHGSPGWTIVFRYTHPSDSTMKKNGRVVTMNLDGSEPRVEHVDFILAKVDKKL